MLNASAWLAGRQRYVLRFSVLAGVCVVVFLCCTTVQEKYYLEGKKEGVDGNLSFIV